MSAKMLKRALGLLFAAGLVLGVVSAASADYPGTVYTPNGSAVQVMIITSELTPDQIQSWRNWVATNYPEATRVRDASLKYNCHSYAWHSQASNNDKWMNNPGDNTYWEDGSYVYFTYGGYERPAGVPLGARASYAYADHSAYVHSSSGTTVQSKWGVGPLMRHRPGYCPYASYVVLYYKRP